MTFLHAYSYNIQKVRQFINHSLSQRTFVEAAQNLTPEKFWGMQSLALAHNGHPSMLNWL